MTVRTLLRLGDALRSARRCESGAAILEFVLVLPLMLALLGGAFELGRAVLIRHAMVEAVCSGARSLARAGDPSCDHGCSPEVARTLALTAGEIVANTGVPPAALTLATRVDSTSRTVILRASLALDADLLRFVGLGPVLTLDVRHQEPRIGP